MSLSQEGRIATIVTPLEGAAVVLYSMTGHERFGRLFSFELELMMDRRDVKGEELLGKPISVCLETGQNAYRYFHGHVVRFSPVLRGSRYAHYQITIAPKLWFLSHRADCRIFQNQTVLEIVKKVWEEQGVLVDVGALRRSYTKWEYCVQYRETDFDFVSRLLQQEGIYYFFKHTKDHHVCVLADSPSSHGTSSGCERLELRYGKELVNWNDKWMDDWLVQERVAPERYVHTDYDFMRPAVNLETRANASGKAPNAKSSIFDFPGGYSDFDDGEQWAKTRMESLTADSVIASGATHCRKILTGCTFELISRDERVTGGRFLVIGITLNIQNNLFESGASKAGMVHCTLTVIPASTNFRPFRATPRPIIPGVQTATVVGPRGKEIHTDSYGRVKVQFHWDRHNKRDDNSSCWIRVAQPLAGKRWGATFMPRIGQEVAVGFQEGDPDSPIVLGSLYNAGQMPPYLGDGLDSKHGHDPNVSGIKTNSTLGGIGFNEIRFDDNKGKEQLFLHAERNLEVTTKNDSLARTYGNRHQIVGSEKDGQKTGDQKEMVYQDKHLSVHRNQVEQVGDSMQLLIGGIDQGQGNQDIVIKGTKKESIGKDDNLQVTGSRKQQIGGGDSLSVGGDLQEKVGQKHALEAGQEIHLKAGMTLIIESGVQVSIKGPGGFIDIGPSGVSIQGTMVLINSGGAAGSGSGSHPVGPEAPVEAKPNQPTLADDSKSGQKSAPS